jgi:hypothetical protein
VLVPLFAPPVRRAGARVVDADRDARGFVDDGAARVPGRRVRPVADDVPCQAGAGPDVGLLGAVSLRVVHVHAAAGDAGPCGAGALGDAETAALGLHGLKPGHGIVEDREGAPVVIGAAGAGLDAVGIHRILILRTRMLDRAVGQRRRDVELDHVGTVPHAVAGGDLVSAGRHPGSAPGVGESPDRGMRGGRAVVGRAAQVVAVQRLATGPLADDEPIDSHVHAGVVRSHEKGHLDGVAVEVGTGVSPLPESRAVETLGCTVEERHQEDEALRAEECGLEVHTEPGGSLSGDPVSDRRERLRARAPLAGRPRVRFEVVGERLGLCDPADGPSREQAQGERKRPARRLRVHACTKQGRGRRDDGASTRSRDSIGRRPTRQRRGSDAALTRVRARA